MTRNRRQIQRGVQWRQNLRNLPVRQAAAVQAASGKQPAAIAAPPQPPPPPRSPQPPQPVVRARDRARGRARGARGRARARGRANPPVPVGRRPIAAAAGGHGEKNIDNAFIRNRGRYKIKRLLPVVKNVEVKRRGITIRRMTARRRAIYPALRQQRQY